MFNQSLKVDLPEKLEELRLGHRYNQSLEGVNLPKNLKMLGLPNVFSLKKVLSCIKIFWKGIWSLATDVHVCSHFLLKGWPFVAAKKSRSSISLFCFLDIGDPTPHNEKKMRSWRVEVGGSQMALAECWAEDFDPWRRVQPKCPDEHSAHSDGLWLQRHRKTERKTQTQ